MQPGENVANLRLQFKRFLVAGLCIVRDKPPECRDDREMHMLIDPRGLLHGSEEFVERMSRLAEEQNMEMTDAQIAEIRAELHLKE